MDRPILFSGPMVRALLDDRKTQTRRIIKPQPTMHDAGDCTIGGHRGPVDYLMCEIYPQHMARFAKGDRLWVKETWSPEFKKSGIKPSELPRGPLWYWADGEPTEGDWTKPKVSIHMVRWASRLTLTVTDVRVQRLQHISEADCIAEGPPEVDNQPRTISGELHPMVLPVAGERWRMMTPRAWYRDLWETINGAGSWTANPWVVAVSFTVERRNIDSALSQPRASARGTPVPEATPPLPSLVK